MNTKIKVGIFLFDEVEVLDFAGPFEVFSIASRDAQKLFQVVTIGETGQVISARNGLQVMPTAKFADETDVDILIVPGGYGAEEIEIKNKTAIDWIKKQQDKVEIMASVCTGAFLLAESGILDHKTATTHWMDIERLKNDYPKVTVIKNVKFIDEGKVITSGGISAGINMSFHIVKRFFGVEIAKQTARRMEYEIEIS